MTIRITQAHMVFWSCAQLCMSTLVFAQSTGTLRVFCEPAGSCQYVLDGKHRMNDRELTLLDGPHRFVFWAPERRMLDTTFLVSGGNLREVKVQLRYSQEFIEYRQQSENHLRNDRWMRYGTSALAVGAGAWAGVSIARAINARKDLDVLGEEYTTSSDPGGISDLKVERIPDANTELRRSRTMAYVSSGAFALSAGAWWYVQKVRRSRTPPVFEDKEKVRFDGLVWTPNASGSGTWAMAVILPIR